jgi:hypothetical protein
MDQVLANTIIDAFIVATDKNQMRKGGKLPGFGLIEGGSCWIQKDNMGVFLANIGQCGGYYIHPHHHPASSAIGRIIHHFMSTKAMIPDLVDLQAEASS